MHSPSKTPKALAHRMGQDNGSSRFELESKLTPLLRLVLRTGQGYPSVVQWVRRTLPLVAPELRLGGSVDPEGAARKLARVLSSQMLQGIRCQRDTVVGRHSVLL